MIIKANMKRIFSLLLAVIICLSYLPINVMANDTEAEELIDNRLVETENTSTPVPTPTPTPTPAPTATLKPEATATPKPTSTATLEPEATATPKPTSTATLEPEATATPTPTSTATLEPEAMATLAPASTATPKPEVTATPKSEATTTPTTESTAMPTATAEIKYPAQTLQGRDDKVYLVVKAPEGALPIGAKVVFKAIEDNTDTKSVYDLLLGELASVQLFDLYFTDGGGTRIQPLQKVHVSIRMESIRTEKDNLHVVYLDINHRAEQIKLLHEGVKEDEITFEFQKFNHIAFAIEADDGVAPTAEPTTETLVTMQGAAPSNTMTALGVPAEPEESTEELETIEASIELNKNELALRIGDEENLTATVVPEGTEVIRSQQ